MNLNVRQGCLVCIALFSLFVAMTSKAEVEFEARAGATYSDNVQKSDDETEDQIIGIGGISLAWSQETRRFVGDLDADVEYRTFFDDAFDDDTVSSADLGLEFKFSPGVFHWVFEDRYGTIRSNPFDANTPLNRENVNRISTGPDLNLRLGGRTSMLVQSRYSSSEFEVSDADSDSLSGVLALRRQTSTNRSVSLNLTADRVEFDDMQGIQGFDRFAAFLGFTSMMSRGRVSTNIGYNEVHDNEDEFAGLFAQLDLTRDLSPTTVLRLTASRRYSDSGDQFGRDNTLGAGLSAVRDLIPVVDPLETSDFSAGLDFSKNRLDFSVTATMSDDDFESSDGFDRQRRRILTRLKLNVSDGWELASNFAYEETEFAAIDRTDDYLTGSVEISRRVAQAFWLSLEYRLDDRSSDAIQQGYRENRVTLMFRFRPGT